MKGGISMNYVPAYAKAQIEKFAPLGYSFVDYEPDTLVLRKGQEGARRFSGCTVEEEDEIAIYKYNLVNKDGEKCGSLMEIVF